jgi:hypothetical protein
MLTRRKFSPGPSITHCRPGEKQGRVHAMWHTSLGDRTLRGDEAALVRMSIESMIDSLLIHVDEEIENEEIDADSRIDCASGIPIYDALTISQRIAVLHDVAKYLLTDTEKVLSLSAELEASVAAIFIEIRDQVAIEIDFPSIIRHHGPNWRKLVRAAYDSVFADSETGLHDEEVGDDLPVPSERDICRWEYLVEALSDAILWDRDFEMADSFLDDDPGVSHTRRRLLGIDDDYFTSIAPDPRPDEVYSLVSRTREIVRAKPR